MKNDKGKRFLMNIVNLMDISLTALRIWYTIEKVIPFGI